MAKNYLAAGLSLAVLSLPAVLAQTPAEQLQKGIYAQETTGDLDTAIHIFRLVASGSPGQRGIAAEAQSRLVQSLLQKHDPDGAALEFGVLARNYPEFAQRIAFAGGVSTKVATTPFFGNVQNGRYRHAATGVELVLQPDWSVNGDGMSSDRGQMVMLHDSKTGLEMGVWMIPEESSPAQISQKLANSIAAKIEMNRDTPGFRFRDLTGERKTIGGNQALSAVADSLDGKAASTYYTWVYTVRTHVVFIAYMTPENFPLLKDRADQLVENAIVP